MPRPTRLPACPYFFVWFDQAEKLMHDQRGQSPEEGDVEREQAFQIAQVCAHVFSPTDTHALTNT